MSWFRHKPPKNPPLPKNTTAPHRSSPASEKAMKEAKQSGLSKSSKK